MLEKKLTKIFLNSRYKLSIFIYTLGLIFVYISLIYMIFNNFFNNKTNIAAINEVKNINYSKGNNLFLHSPITVGTSIKTSDFRDKNKMSIINENFNLLTPEFELKWNAIQPSPDEFDFRAIDDIVAKAKANNQEIHGHTLVWHKNVPFWLKKEIDETPQDKKYATLRKYLEIYIKTVVKRYDGIIKSWDVVNEVMAPPTDPGHKNIFGYRQNSFWYQILGDENQNQIPDYIELSFEFAREASKSARLYLNEYNIEYLNPLGIYKPDTEAFDDVKQKSVKTLLAVKSMLNAGIKIDGVGIQGHVTNNKILDTEYKSRLSLMNYAPYQTMQEYSRLGLLTRITESDVYVYAKYPNKPDTKDLEKQAMTYHNYFLSCMYTTGCQSFSVWQLSDKNNWYPEIFGGQYYDYHPNIFDANLLPKPAYKGLFTAIERYKQGL